MSWSLVSCGIKNYAQNRKSGENNIVLQIHLEHFTNKQSSS